MSDLFSEPAPPHILGLLAMGLLILLVAWAPLLLRRLPLSLPMLSLGAGAALFLAPMPPAAPWAGLSPSPIVHPLAWERAAEFVVIVSLMGTGLRIDTLFSIRRWAVTWRLLGLTMPLSIAAIALLGLWAGFPLAAALLLAAALAPTDPVLASDVQVGPPGEGEEDQVRFGLTSEAGLNDGLAFPFVNLAIAVAAAGLAPSGWLQEWLLVDVLWKLAIGLLGGWLVGRALGWLTFHIPAHRLEQTGDGILAVAATFLAYALTELAHGYGFLAVFVAALTLRHAHRGHDFHAELHDLADQVERLSMAVVLVAFGGAIATGLFASLRPGDVLLALAVLLIVRPAAGLLGLVGLPLARPQRLAIAFFGIRGIGSFYYLAHALNQQAFAEADRLWAILGLIVLLSILLHGVTATAAMHRLDRRKPS